MNTYWHHIRVATGSLLGGLKLTFIHLLRARRSEPIAAISDARYFDQRQGIATIQYPHVSLPVPEVGRYKLHNEIDDCIVCDKCAIVCPVDCITIEPIRSADTFGKTSDGTAKRIYAAKFDIDMAKCCFCGLCTTVCPTECLTMTNEFDFSVPDIQQHTFSFADMTAAQITEKKAAWEAHQQNKQTAPGESATATPKIAKPVMKPRITPPNPTAE